MNFERAYWCRAYHYEYIRDEKYNKQVTDVDGIYKMDLHTGEAKKIIDIDTIINTDYREEFKDAKHWVEHIMLDPTGTKFAFYHRFDAGGGFRTRCFVADMEGNILTCLKDWETNSWSHLGWIDSESFVIFSVRRRALGNAYSAVTQKSGVLGQLLRKIYRRLFAKHVNVQAHHKLAASSCYDIYGVDGKKRGVYDKGKLVIDGHPSFTLDGRYMLTDTYADDENYRNLLIFDTKTEKLYMVARFESPINATAYRSDLHPRFGHTEDTLIVDSAHTGRHGMVVLRIPEDLLRDN